MASITHEPSTGVTSVTSSQKSRALLQTFEREGGNALNAVIGYAELLGSEAVDVLPPHQRDWLRHLLTSCQQTKDLFEALLTASAAEANELTLSFAPERFSRVVQHAVRGATWEALEHGVTLGDLGPLPDLHVMGDVRALDRVIRGVLRHLIGSAGAEGQVSVEAHLGAENDVILSFEAAGPSCQACTPAALLIRAWQKVLALHDGELNVDDTGMRALLRLPRKVDDAAG